MDRHERIDEQLAQVPLFSGLSKKEIRLISQLATYLEEPAGTVLDDTLAIACGEGAVRVLEVQRSGRKPMDATQTEQRAIATGSSRNSKNERAARSNIADETRSRT